MVAVCEVVAPSPPSEKVVNATAAEADKVEEEEDVVVVEVVVCAWEVVSEVVVVVVEVVDVVVLQAVWFRVSDPNVSGFRLFLHGHVGSLLGHDSISVRASSPSPHSEPSVLLQSLHL